jgi:threonine dehydrogenase-like Zn-dependent dehydrogenase
MEPGLSQCLSERTSGRGADGVLLTAGNPALISTTLTWLRGGGTCTIFASLHPESQVLLDWNQLYYRELNIVSSYSPAPADLAEALNLLGQRTVRVSALTNDRFTLERFSEALAAIESRSILKAIMIPNG